MGPLEGARPDLHVLESIVLALEVQPLLGPAATDHLDRLVEDLARLRLIDAEAAVLDRLVAAAHTEVDPAAR